MTFFSVLVPTLGRTLEVKRLLDSLTDVEYSNFEVVVIDQNKTNAVLDIVNGCKTLQITYIKSSKLGLSYNRNKGIKRSKGEWIVIADDDAVFSKTFFLELEKEISSNPKIDIWVTNVKNLCDHEFYSMKPSFKTGDFKLSNYRELVSLSLTIRKSTFALNGYFDEIFGVGSKFGACEESDWVIRAYNNGLRFGRAYDSNVYHPKFIKNINDLQRISNYSYGFGAFFRKQIRVNNFGLSLSFFLKFCILIFRSVVGFVLNIYNKKRNYYYSSIVWKLKGFVHYKAQ